MEKLKFKLGRVFAMFLLSRILKKMQLFVYVKTRIFFSHGETSQQIRFFSVVITDTLTTLGTKPYPKKLTLMMVYVKMLLLVCSVFMFAHDVINLL